MPTLEGGAWSLGRRLLLIWGVTSRPSAAGRGARGCRSIASFIASSGQFMPTRRNSMRGGIAGLLPRQTDAADADSALEIARHGARARRWLVVCGVAILALLVVAYFTTRSRLRGATRSKIRSLAVLPLKNLSGDPTQEYLADGMTEALIGRLSSIHDLRVISRTSAMQFKNTPLSVPEIAKTLHIDAIVEGSVIRDAGRIRVHAQLIRAATDEHCWSEIYDRELRDVLALQSEVAQSIARKVEITLTRA